MASKNLSSPSDVIHNAIKKHGDLTDWDDDAIEFEVKAILRALKRKGYEIVQPS